MLFPRRLFGSRENQNAPASPEPNGPPPSEPSTFHGFGVIHLAPPAPTPHPPQRSELPRLQIPPLALIQPQQPQQPQLHWKSFAVDQPPPPPQPPVSRMRMVANFFSSEARQQQQQQQQQNQLQSPPPSGGLLPSFSEMMARTKQLYIHQTPAPAITADHEMEQAEDMIEEHMDNQYHEHAPREPNYAVARYSLQPPAPIDVASSIDGGGDDNDVPPSPSNSTASGKANKRRERWTEDEHARFMEGLNRYGRKWKKIQAFVQTKTAVQVRTHAYGYFAKLLRNMPEDDAAWELAEEMSSLPGAVLKGPTSGKRRSEPKTDAAGMDILRRFVFSKKKMDALPKRDLEAGSVALEPTPSVALAPLPSQQLQLQHHQQQWVQDSWNLAETQASSGMLDLKRQRIN